jgi:hypothetical protein
MAVKYLSRALSKEGKEWRLVREEAVKALAEIARVSPILIAMTWRQLQEDARHQDQTENYWYQGRYDDSAELCTRHTDSGTYVGLPDFPQGLDL